MRVLLSLPVPVKLHLHPAILVAEDRFARWADYCRSLCPVDRRLRGGQRRAEGQCQGNAGELICVFQRRALAAARVPQTRAVRHTRQDVVAVSVEVFLQGEYVSGGELATVACPADSQALGGLLLDAQPGHAGVVLEDLLEVAGAVAAAGVDA